MRQYYYYLVGTHLSYSLRTAQEQIKGVSAIKEAPKEQGYVVLVGLTFSTFLLRLLVESCDVTHA